MRVQNFFFSQFCRGLKGKIGRFKNSNFFAGKGLGKGAGGKSKIKM
jgi:hypothetical protein